MSNRLAPKQFIEKLNKIVPNRNYKILSEYKNAKTKIFVQDNFGLCLVDIRTLFRSTTEFNIRSAVNKTEYLVNKLSYIHKGKYNYSKTIYTKDTDKIKIICPEHGEFEQKTGTHILGKGCNKCGNKTISKKKINFPTGWSYQNWIKASNRSKNFDSFKVYIIQCWNDDEEFYKIGKTFTTVDYRFKSEMPYNWNIIKVFKGNALKVCKLEKQLQKKNSKFKYIPKLKFNGMYECFENINI